MASKPSAFGWVELASGAVVLLAALYTCWFLQANGYLPQPFFFDTGDTLMDFYSTAYWSHSEGPYSVWQSIYPPLSFVLLRVSTPAQCYREDAFVGRDCDPLGWSVILLGGLWLAMLIWQWTKEADWQARVARLLAVAIGFPTLYCVERGNLLLLAAPALVFALARPVMDQRGSFGLAVAINLKPYLAVLLLPVFIKHGGRATGRVIFAALAVYLGSVIVVGDGLPWSILQNIRGFSTGEGLFNYWEKFYFSTSFSALIRILSSELPLESYLDGKTALRVAAVLRLALPICTFALACALAASLRLPHSKRPLLLMCGCVLAWLMVFTEALGGYAIVFLIALIFIAPERGRLLGCSLVLCYMLSLPYDHIVAVVREAEAPVWLTGREVETRYGVAVGQIARPAGIVLIQVLISLSIVSAALPLGRSTKGISYRMPKRADIST